MQTTRTLRPNVTSTILLASVLALFLVGLSPLPQLLAATSTSNSGAAGATLNPVQLSIQTKSITAVSSYELVAYNSTGMLVASYTGQYPRVTLELPSGTYLFAATVYGPTSSQPPVCCVCAQSGGTGTGVASPPAQTSQKANASSGIAFPCVSSNPPVEYGYSLTQVSGSASLTIDTQSPSGIPTANLSVSVSFKNGTAVSNADVSASVVGTNFYWGDSSNLTLYAQTAANGVARLVVPAVPLTVTASDSVQVNLPQGQTTVQVKVGGQLVNVTVYYSPNYVYESATALVVPPQTSVSMVVTAQTQSSLIPYAVGSASSGGGATNAATGAPTTSSQGQQASPGGAAGTLSSGSSTTTEQTTSIPPIPASDVAAQPSSNGSGINLLEVGILALAGAIAALVGVAISRSRR
jgi:hypothetical protein